MNMRDHIAGLAAMAMLLIAALLLFLMGDHDGTLLSVLITGAGACAASIAGVKPPGGNSSESKTPTSGSI